MAAVIASAAASALAADRVLEKTVVVAAPVADVYRTWTTPEGMKSFIAQGAVIEMKPGGKYEIYFDTSAPEGQRGSEGCEVLSFVENRMLSFTWNAPPQFPEVRQQRSFVVVHFSPIAGNQTRVDLTHGGWGQGEQWDKVYDYFDKAWTVVLTSLKEKVSAKPESAHSDRVLAELSRMIGGVWEGQVQGPEGPLVVEFQYSGHPDGKGVVGTGVIGKGSKNPVHVRNAFGIDPLTGKVYYLDSHNSGTVYYGHMDLEGDAMTFTFGPVGGRMDAFTSKSKLADEDTYQSIIKDKEGKELVGLVLKRRKA